MSPLQRLNRFVDLFAHDARHAARAIRNRPGFAAVVVGTLALGIGVVTLVFSAVNALILQPLPIDDPSRVVFVQPNGPLLSHSFPNYRDIRDRNSTFEGLMGYRMSPMDIESGGGVGRVWGYLATGNYFDVLGVRPELGRFFNQSDDRTPGAAPFAVLSYDFFQARFLGNPAVVGSTIRINRLPYTVVGVAPRGFFGAESFFRPDLWVPMMMQAQIEVGNPWLEQRRTFNTWIAGRLKAGVSEAQATANLNAIAAALAREFPEANQGLSFKLTKPGFGGDLLRGPAQAFTTGLLALAGFVLLIACANLASALSARGADRAREIAIRLSIGASRGRIVGQLLTESLLLSLAAGTVGYAVAHVASAALSSRRLPIDLPVQLDINPDARVFAFSFVAALAAGLVFGLAPARQASRTDANAALKNVDAAIGRTRLPLRDLLVGVQVALCFVLVAACLLSLRGLQQAVTMPVGFQPNGVSMVGFELGLAGYDPVRGAAFQQRALEAVSRLPGVERAAIANTLPLYLDQSGTTVYPEEQTDFRPGTTRSASPYFVSPGFLETLRIQLLRGRSIDVGDTSSSRRVAVVNEVFVRDVLRTTEPLGRRFRFGPRSPLMEVVGVVADGKYRTLTEDPQAAVFVPSAQRYMGTTTLLVRADVPESAMLAQIRRTLAELDPSLPLYSVQSLGQMLELALFPNRIAATALGSFGLLAIVLAATGIHGAVAYAVARRRREIGIRIAIGATSLSVLRLMFGRVAALVTMGAAAGAGLGFMLGPLLTKIVYQASPREPLVFAAVATVMVGVALAACWAPAIRSLRIQPVVALRSE